MLSGNAKEGTGVHSVIWIDVCSHACIILMLSAQTVPLVAPLLPAATPYLKLHMQSSKHPAYYLCTDVPTTCMPSIKLMAAQVMLTLRLKTLLHQDSNFYITYNCYLLSFVHVVALLLQ